MRNQVYRERTALRLTLLAALVAVMGILLLVISAECQPPAISTQLNTVIRDLGSILLVSVVVTLLWENIAKRAYAAELLATTGLAEEIHRTGLVGVSEKWQGEANWENLFASSDTFELLFAYGETWRNTNRAFLTEFAARSGVHATIALPDPDSSLVVDELARRFNKKSQEVADSIRKAETDFINIFTTGGAADQKLEIWHTAIAPVWSYYRFDGLAIFTLYKYRKERLDVPTFTVKKDGTLYQFLQGEFKGLLSPGEELAQKSYPRPPETT